MIDNVRDTLFGVLSEPGQAYGSLLSLRSRRYSELEKHLNESGGKDSVALHGFCCIFAFRIFQRSEVLPASPANTLLPGCVVDEPQ